MNFDQLIPNIYCLHNIWNHVSMTKWAVLPPDNVHLMSTLRTLTPEEEIPDGIKGEEERFLDIPCLAASVNVRTNQTLNPPSYRNLYSNINQKESNIKNGRIPVSSKFPPRERGRH